MRATGSRARRRRRAPREATARHRRPRRPRPGRARTGSRPKAICGQEPRIEAGAVDPRRGDRSRAGRHAVAIVGDVFGNVVISVIPMVSSGSHPLVGISWPVGKTWPIKFWKCPFMSNADALETQARRLYTTKQMGDACEMLVAAELTLAGVPALKVPDNWPGYDVIAQPAGIEPQWSLPLVHGRQLRRLVIGDQRLDQLVQRFAGDHLVELVERQVDAVVGDPALREIVGADALRSGRRSRPARAAASERARVALVALRVRRAGPAASSWRWRGSGAGSSRPR